MTARRHFDGGVLMVECPYCHAPAGDTCRKADGTPVSQFPHAVRTYEAALTGHMTLAGRIPPREEWFISRARARRDGSTPVRIRVNDDFRGQLAEALKQNAVADWNEDGEGGKALVLEIYLDDAVLAVLGVIGTEPEGLRP